jgi:hypothetical protein
MGREYAWSERMGWALSMVERNLARLTSPAEDRENRFDECNFSRPGVSEFSTILYRCRRLRRAVQELAQPFTTPTELDLSPILQGGRELLTSLRQLSDIQTNELWNAMGAKK